MVLFLFFNIFTTDTLSRFSEVIAYEEQEHTESDPHYEIQDKFMRLAVLQTVILETQDCATDSNYGSKNHIDNANRLSHNEKWIKIVNCDTKIRKKKDTT
jgi:hypothetical protein